MKVLLLTLAITMVSCASNSQKKMEEKPQASAATAQVETKAEPVKAEAPKKEALKFGKFVTCSSGENERILKNETSDMGGCEVLYTKEGVEDSIATAQNDIDYCQEIVDRVANKLVNAGFNCTDNKQTQKQ